MKAIRKPILPDEDQSFRYARHIETHFYDIWHLHEQMEIVLIVSGTGTLMIGDDMGRFNPGTLVLIGSQLPHVWKSDPEYYRPETELKSEATVFHFNEDFLGEEFFKKIELKRVKDLFDRSARGILFSGSITNKVGVMFSLIEESESNYHRLLLFLDILKSLAEEQKVRYLSGRYTAPKNLSKISESLSRVVAYTFQNFNTVISLEEVAEIAAMSVSNFCRYFKANMQKTYLEFLTEIRINQVCRLLIETEGSIQNIAWSCGFHNLSNFNRSFRKAKGISPRQYRMLHQ